MSTETEHVETLRSAGATPRRVDGFAAIDDYAAIGDSRVLALVARDGSIDWLCLPSFDSPSVFGALLDPARGGRFSLAPAIPYQVERRYLERTNVLETTFVTARGRVRVTDAVTYDKAGAATWRELARKVDGVAGSVPMEWRVHPRFESGHEAGSIVAREGALVFRHGGLQLGLLAFDAGEPSIGDDSISGAFTAEEGHGALLGVVCTENEPVPMPPRAAIEKRIEETCDVWRSWLAHHTYHGPWRDAVERSALSLKLLADARSGAITAAGTTSLPEALGKSRNYDYRFAWTRDLSFTLDALMSVGLEDVTHTSFAWMLRAIQHTHPRIDPVYRLDGSVLRSQSELDLAGYRGTRPVHVGNKAGAQLQLGGFGDLFEAAWLYVQHGNVLDEQTGARLADNVNLLLALWRNDDAGLWELPDQADYTTSKLGCWVAFDRAVQMAEREDLPQRHLDRWRHARDEARDHIETRLWSERKRSYVQKAGSDALDAGVLLAAPRHFTDPRGSRMNSTIDAIRDELGAGGPLLYRYSGMQDEENAFLACSFWMVDALALAGRVDEAAETMDALVGLANDVGLYSEEMEPESHALRGNLPQALTHLSLITAAARLAQALAGRGGRPTPPSASA